MYSKSELAQFYAFCSGGYETRLGNTLLTIIILTYKSSKWLVRIYKSIENKVSKYLNQNSTDKNIVV